MEAEDPTLRVLMRFADDESLSFGVPVTVFAGSTRATGVLSSRLAYAKHVDASLQEGFTKATGSGAEHAATIAGLFDGKMTELAEANNARRAELSAILDDLAHDGQRAGTGAQKEFEKLDRVEVVTLQGARIWGPGFNPLHGPLEVEFFRIPVRAIDGWLLGTPG